MTMVTMKKTAWCSASHQDTEYAVHVHQDTAARVQHSVHFDSLETTFDALTMMMPFSLSLLSVHTHTALFSQSRITYSAHSPLDSCIYLVIVYQNAFLLSLALSLSRSLALSLSRSLALALARSYRSDQHKSLSNRLLSCLFTRTQLLLLYSRCSYTLTTSATHVVSRIIHIYDEYKTLFQYEEFNRSKDIFFC